MDERVRFIGDLASCRYTMTELCALYGISRKTGYKWADRYKEEGVDGLKERSRRPQSSPRRTEARCIEALLKERRSHPRWGPASCWPGCTGSTRSGPGLPPAPRQPS